ncbi:hypothetical protein D3C73_1646840 [compost metagenome]
MQQLPSVGAGVLRQYKRLASQLKGGHPRFFCHRMLRVSNHVQRLLAQRQCSKLIGRIHHIEDQPEIG